MIRAAKFSVQLAALILAMSALTFSQSPSQDQDGGFIDGRLRVADQASAEQPHWIAPLFTTTPRLLEQLRYDVSEQPKGAFDTTNFGGGKGLELIPTHNTELLVSTPVLVSHTKPGVPDGIGDMSFLFKYRIAARNEQSGNFIVTAFLGATVPTGSHSNGATSAVITPTIALGKGWGRFDFQTTAGVSLPTQHADKLGNPFSHNIAFQYRLWKILWPELEVNSTFWANGTQAGDKQVFLSPGVMLGKMHLWKRLNMSIGEGVQIPVTHFHTVDRTWLTSVRFPF
ncbi:MAG TPA: transporter [Candidatus Angelobacter sp.]|nr:transporter [Candidatus Angelobacter sp.]